MKTALITGVSGYLGSHLAKALKLSGWRVAGLDLRHTDNQYVDAFYPCDVTKQSNLYTIFDREDVHTVFHLAGRIEVGESVKHPTRFWHHNTMGTNTLVESMTFWGVRNIVYSSTAGLYSSSNNKLSEDSKLSPDNNPYASSKYASELIIQQSGLNYIIFRYFNLAGADTDGEMGECHEPETHLIPRILQNLNNFTIYGTDYDTPDGTCVRDFIHVSDVADAHVLATQYLMNTSASKIMNLGTGHGYSVKDILKTVGEIVGEKVAYRNMPRRQGDPAYLIAYCSLAAKVLKFEPKHDIISIVQTAYYWQLKLNDKQKT
jgi:UDP-glucose 4-epimerase